MLRKALLYLALTTLTQCSKCKQDDPAPLDQLPPATQTGANTFGCLVNGQVYIPQGNTGTSNFSVLYEPGPMGANLNIQTYSINKNRRQFVNLSCGPVTQSRAYSLNIPVVEGTASYTDTSLPSPCSAYIGNMPPVYRKGRLTITRLDNNAGIIAGTFEVTFAVPGCDTLKITQGRFDARF